MRGLVLVLLLASACGSSGPRRTSVPPGVHPDIVQHDSCRLDDGTFAAEGVTADLDDDCNECTTSAGCAPSATAERLSGCACRS